MAYDSSFGDYRIGEGGLLRRFETAAHLTSLPRQIATVLAVTWVPIVVLGLWGEQVRGRAEPMLHDPALHVRLLVAAPVFLVLDRLFPLVCRRMLGWLAGQAFIPDAAKPRFERLLRRAQRLADSPLPEGLLALVGVGIGVGALVGVVPVSGLSRPMSPAQVWYALTDLPVFQFLLWRSLWRWVVWVRILVGLSRIDLKLVATHPDRRGGIAFLRLPSIDYCAGLLFAVASVVCAEIKVRATVGATLASFKPLVLVFVAVGAFIAFGPLLVFAPQLFRAHRKGILQVGDLAANHGRRFHRRWITGTEDHGAVGSSDIQDLAALGQTYREDVNRLRVLLFYKRDMIVLLAATLLPVVPVMLVRIPLQDWRGLLGLITGGVPF